MLSKISQLSTFLLVLPLFAVAGPLEARNGGGSDCSTGPIQCCQSTQSDASGLTGVVAAAVSALLVVDGPLVGINCSPITVVGTQCSGQTVCCKDNHVGGPNSLVSVGCVNVVL